MKIPKIRKLPSGSFFCQLRLNGQSISITDTTEERVLAKALAYKTGIIKQKKKPEEMTLRQACMKEIDLKRSRLSPTTIAEYERIVSLRFQSIMDVQLRLITQRMIDKAVSIECATKTRTGRTIDPKTIKNAFTFIAPILRKNGVEIGEVRLPEKKRKLVKILPAEQVIPVIIGTDIELPCLLAAWLSLTMSEIRGLTKSKSIQNHKLYIVETLVTVKGEDIRKVGGKEEERSRVLDIPPYIEALIDKVEGDIIVPLTARTITARFSRLLERNELPHMSFHQLRHLSASVMAMLGVDEKTAQERGGWKTPHVMKQVYTHTFTAQRQAADAKMDSYFQSIIANANANENAETA